MQKQAFNLLHNIENIIENRRERNGTEYGYKNGYTNGYTNDISPFDLKETDINKYLKKRIYPFFGALQIPGDFRL